MKIDTSKIENFESMTAEEKVQALQDFDFETEDVEKLKNAVSKANSECASWKKKYNETLSTETQKQQAKEEETEKLKNEVATLQKQIAVSSAKAKYLSLGYSEELAKESATNLIDGNFEKVFDLQNKFVVAKEKALKAELLKQTPTPAQGQEPDSKMTKEDFKKLSARERTQFFMEHPEEYKEIFKE